MSVGNRKSPDDAGIPDQVRADPEQRAKPRPDGPRVAPGPKRYPTREERIRAGLDRYRDLVPEWEVFLEVCGRPLPTCAWLNPGRCADAEPLLRDGFVMESLPWRPGGYRLLDGPSMAGSMAYRAGLFHVQEEASMIPARLLAPRSGDRVLDLCAAPGNKTAELAVMVGPSGVVIANDRAGSRLNTLRTTVDRLGLTNVRAANQDGRSRGWLGHAFDAVLVDVPCSCDGTVRKHPRAAWKTSLEHRARLSDLQTELLMQALTAVRPGGRVVYSTCSFAPEENELVVQRALDALSNVSIIPPGDVLAGLAWDPGLVRWQGQEMTPDMVHTVRLWPHRADTGGFYAALLEVGGPRATDAARRASSKRVGGTRADGPGRSVSANSSTIEPPPATPDQTESPPPDLIEWISSEFGLQPGWDEVFEFRLTDNTLEVHSAGLPATAPAMLSATGLTLFRMNGTTPKLTTAGALLLGSHISRQWVDIGREQAVAFFRRQSVKPVKTEAARYGYVQVRMDGQAIGVGHFRPESGLLESLYPKTWGGLGPPPA